MAHDVPRLSMCIDHPDETAVHVEDGRNPDGSKAGNTGSRTWACSCRASSPVVSALGLARFRISAQFFWQTRSCLRGKKKPPPKAEVWGLIEPSSLGVRSASVGQVWMGIVSDFFAACVVVLAAVGQLDTSFGRGCWSFVGVTSIEKSSHG